MAMAVIGEGPDDDLGISALGKPIGLSGHKIKNA